MKYLLFLGCVIPYRVQSYEISARKVLGELGIELVDMPTYNCCGFPIEAISYEARLMLAARNLCIAEEQGLDIITLCPGCAETLHHTNVELKEDEELRNTVNERLSEVGLEFKGKINVKHFARMLVEDFGVEKIKDRVVRPLEKFMVAQHTGCHIARPKKLMQFEDPENPTALKKLIEATGATCLSYEDEAQCCGGPVSGIDREIPIQLVGDKLKRVKGVGAQALITICPYCHLMYEGMQPLAERKLGEKLRIPVIHYPQLLGLAMGMSPEELALNMLKIKPTQLLEKI